MLTFIALPLLIILVSILLGLAFAAMQRRAHRHDQLSFSGPALIPRPTPPPPPVHRGHNGDAVKLEQLIAFERRLNPSASEAELELRAFQRMRRERGKN